MYVQKDRNLRLSIFIWCAFFFRRLKNTYTCFRFLTLQVHNLFYDNDFFQSVSREKNGGKVTSIPGNRIFRFTCLQKIRLKTGISGGVISFFPAGGCYSV
jgi:hypothetical protein